MPLCQEANETETNIYEVKAATEVHQSDKGINYEDHLSWLPRSPHPTHPLHPVEILQIITLKQSERSATKCKMNWTQFKYKVYVYSSEMLHWWANTNQNREHIVSIMTNDKKEKLLAFPSAEGGSFVARQWKIKAKLSASLQHKERVSKCQRSKSSMEYLSWKIDNKNIQALHKLQHWWMFFQFGLLCTNATEAPEDILHIHWSTKK